MRIKFSINRTLRKNKNLKGTLIFMNMLAKIADKAVVLAVSAWGQALGSALYDVTRALYDNREMLMDSIKKHDKKEN